MKNLGLAAMSSAFGDFRMQAIAREMPSFNELAMLKSPEMSDGSRVAGMIVFSDLRRIRFDMSVEWSAQIRREIPRRASMAGRPMFGCMEKKFDSEAKLKTRGKDAARGRRFARTDYVGAEAPTP